MTHSTPLPADTTTALPTTIREIPREAPGSCAFFLLKTDSGIKLLLFAALPPIIVWSMFPEAKTPHRNRPVGTKQCPLFGPHFIVDKGFARKGILGALLSYTPFRVQRGWGAMGVKLFG